MKLINLICFILFCFVVIQISDGASHILKSNKWNLKPRYSITEMEDSMPIFNSVLLYLIKNKNKDGLFKFLNDSTFRQELMKKYKIVASRKYFKNRL
jgi:hypothetical protein